MEHSVTPDASSKPPQRERLLRISEVETIVGLKKSSIYRLISLNPPEFPAPVKLSRRAVCWPASTIDAWVASRIAAGQGGRHA